MWTKITDIPAKPLNPTATFTQEDDTPSRTLLPVAETEGVTSGAVQPPGPKRDDIVHTGTHSQDPGDESDPTTTFTEEDDTDELNAIGDLEDEEERLIINGGTGIPIGPVSHSFHLCLYASLRNPGWCPTSPLTSLRPSTCRP